MGLELIQNLKNGLEEAKDNFIDSAIGTAVDKGVNFGIRCILPEFAEDAVIGIKDKIMDAGLGDTIVDTVKGAIDVGKNAIKNVAENISDGINNIKKVQEIVSENSMQKQISDILDDVLDKIEKTGDAGRSIFKMVKEGKEAILVNIDKNINSNLNNQIKGLQNVDKYISSWRDCYNNKDFNGMEKQYKKLASELKELLPVEQTLADARNIEILHNLIKNNGKNFELTTEEQELAEKLSI